jgi:hypothetical protein
VHAQPFAQAVFSRSGVAVRTLTVSLLGVVAVAASLVLLRQQRQPEVPRQPRITPAGETVPGTISLERIRELGY